MAAVQIGDVLPWNEPQGILGPALRDANGRPTDEWYILRTAPQKEAAAKAKLERLGVLEAWYPTVDVTRRKPRATLLVTRKQRVAPGYLFTRWGHEPRWHLLRDMTNGFVASVVSIGERPWCIGEALIAKMALVPHRIEEMRRAEETRVQAEERQRVTDRLARRPAPGDLAVLMDGPLAGLTVAVLDVRAGVATWEGEGIKGTAQVEAMERLA